MFYSESHYKKLPLVIGGEWGFKCPSGHLMNLIVLYNFMRFNRMELNIRETPNHVPNFDRDYDSWVTHIEDYLRYGNSKEKYDKKTPIVILDLDKEFPPTFIGVKRIVVYPNSTIKIGKSGFIDIHKEYQDFSTKDYYIIETNIVSDPDIIFDFLSCLDIALGVRARIQTNSHSIFPVLNVANAIKIGAKGDKMDTTRKFRTHNEYKKERYSLTWESRYRSCVEFLTRHGKKQTVENLENDFKDLYRGYNLGELAEQETIEAITPTGNVRHMRANKCLVKTEISKSLADKDCKSFADSARGIIRYQAKCLIIETMSDKEIKSLGADAPRAFFVKYPDFSGQEKLDMALDFEGVDEAIICGINQSLELISESEAREELFYLLEHSDSSSPTHYFLCVGIGMFNYRCRNKENQIPLR